jgi:predicted amidohydrolase YtcJ
MIDAYADAPGGNAPLMFTPDQIRALFTAIDDARFQIHVHVIGDRAAPAALDGLEAARAANGAWPGLHQLAHLQVVAPGDFARLAALGAMANIQPLWARHDTVVPDEWIDMIGPARLPRTYAFRQMLDAGAPFCLSSDFPVSTLNPFEIMETAVTRQPRRRDGSRPPFLPAERLTVAEAVAGYTCHAARACWRGEDTGRLLPGFSADLVILDRDIFRCAPHEIGDTEVMATLFRGDAVWRHEAFQGGDFA